MRARHVFYARGSIFPSRSGAYSRAVREASASPQNLEVNMEAALSKTASVIKPALEQLKRKLRSAAHEFGASVDRYLNRLYESLPKDRPNV